MRQTHQNLPLTERNESIYQDYLDGLSHKELIIKHNLSYARIVQIIKRQAVLAKIK